MLVFRITIENKRAEFHGLARGFYSLMKNGLIGRSAEKCLHDMQPDFHHEKRDGYC
jgi:hypothetical protein